MSHGLNMSNIIGEAVLLQAEKTRARYVTEVNIELGKLACFSRRDMENYLLMRFENTVAEGAEIKVTEIIPKILCNECNFKGELQAFLQNIINMEYYRPRCPKCESININLLKGKECTLKQIKIIQ